MSYNWENIVWQNKDGKWGIGFYERIKTGDYFDPDYDSEWRDEFDPTKFSYASTGHTTEQQAKDSWRGVNPGSHTIVDYTADNAEEIAEYEEMARACNDPAYAKEREERRARERRTARRKVLRDRLRQDPPKANLIHIVSVEISEGLTSSHEGILKKEGDWLTLAFPKRLKSGRAGKPTLVKVWNTKTKNPGPSIANVTMGYSSLGYGFGIPRR